MTPSIEIASVGLGGNLIPATNQLESVTVILPVVNETTSLRETVQTLKQIFLIREFLIVVCNKTTLESLTVCEEICRNDPSRFRILKQSRPFLGGAMRDAFEAGACSHILMMASDLETDPATVPEMIKQAENSPNAIITASRWIGGGSFEGYNHAKLLANYCFQKFFSLLYCTRLSDMTFGFRIFPAALVKCIRWEENKHPFLFETILKPLRLGIEVIEVPSRWCSRKDGESQNTVFDTFDYWRVGLRMRFLRPKDILILR